MPKLFIILGIPQVLHNPNNSENNENVRVSVYYVPNVFQALLRSFRFYYHKTLEKYFSSLNVTCKI